MVHYFRHCYFTFTIVLLSRVACGLRWFHFTPVDLASARLEFVLLRLVYFDQLEFISLFADLVDVEGTEFAHWGGFADESWVVLASVLGAVAFVVRLEVELSESSEFSSVEEFLARELWFLVLVGFFDSQEELLLVQAVQDALLLKPFLETQSAAVEFALAQWVLANVSGAHVIQHLLLAYTEILHCSKLQLL